MPTTRTRSAPTKASASAPCQARRGTLNLEKGKLTVEGLFNHTGDSVFAITGGTGDYAGAQGDMLLSAYGSKGDAYTFIYRLK